jgi:hypothetical protein
MEIASQSDPPGDLSYATSWQLSAQVLMAEKMLHVKSPLVLQHKVNGPAQLVGVYSQGLALVILAG